MNKISYITSPTIRIKYYCVFENLVNTDHIIKRLPENWNVIRYEQKTETPLNCTCAIKIKNFVKDESVIFHLKYQNISSIFSHQCLNILSETHLSYNFVYHYNFFEFDKKYKGKIKHNYWGILEHYDELDCMLKTYDVGVYINILLQLIVGIDVMQKTCHLVHHDLHQKNIMIMSPETKYNIITYVYGDNETDNISFNCYDFIPVIIDFDKLSVKYSSYERLLRKQHPLNMASNLFNFRNEKSIYDRMIKEMKGKTDIENLRAFKKYFLNFYNKYIHLDGIDFIKKFKNSKLSSELHILYDKHKDTSNKRNKEIIFDIRPKNIKYVESEIEHRENIFLKLLNENNKKHAVERIDNEIQSTTNVRMTRKKNLLM